MKVKTNGSGVQGASERTKKTALLREIKASLNIAASCTISLLHSVASGPTDAVSRPETSPL